MRKECIIDMDQQYDLQRLGQLPPNKLQEELEVRVEYAMARAEIQEKLDSVVGELKAE